MKMATSSKNKKSFEPIIDEIIIIDPKKLITNPPSEPPKKIKNMIKRTYRPIHNKFNSVYTQKSKYQDSDRELRTMGSETNDL